jgi:hypothetical protein
MVGRCIDQSRGQSFAVMDNGYVFQEQFPANAGFAVRDPSGMNFLRMPAANPMAQAYFVDWAGRVVEINPSGAFVIGGCQFAPGFLPANPYPQGFYQPPVMASWGVRTEQGVQPMPEDLARPRQRYVEPLFATAESAQACMDQSGGDEDAFGDCMMHAMLGPREQAAYDCARSTATPEEVAVCLVGAVGGENERRAAAQLAQCQERYQDHWDQYPLCLAGQNANPETARLLACVQQQAEDGEVTWAGTAVCYGAGSLQLNPEMQIAVECAVTSGGQPLAFAGCAGGRLTARELEKCFTDGVGGSGCFGPNNEIVKALRAVGIDMEDAFGPNNDAVRTWNNAVHDLQNGPGPNNDAVRAVTTVANDLANGPGRNNDIVQAVDQVIPGFADIF